jgi:hypothetical protein
MNWKAGAIGLAIAGAMAFGLGVGQASQKVELTAQDYIEIQDLNTRYARGFDFGEREGAAWAETFTPDGVFVSGGREVKGHAALSAYANDFFKTRGKGNTRHWIGNMMLTPTDGGVHAREYVLFISTASPASILSTVQYDDLIVKTADGWRIKRRTLVSDQKPAQ